MSGDVRKDFVIATVSNYFSTPVANLAKLTNTKEINNFLDDGNQYVLVALKRNNGNGIQLFSDLTSNQTDEPCIVFFKIKPEVITGDNVHSNVLVSSMFSSPVSTLYHAIKKIFAPLILNSEGSAAKSAVVDPKLQSLLTDLESGLATHLRRTGVSFDASRKSSDKENFGSILTPSDEFAYWKEIASGSRDERAAFFSEVFEKSNFARDFGNLESLELVEVVDVVDISLDILDEIWKQDEHKVYPEVN